jgi:hypothetical protein
MHPRADRRNHLKRTSICCQQHPWTQPTSCLLAQQPPHSRPEPAAGLPHRSVACHGPRFYMHSWKIRRTFSAHSPMLSCTRPAVRYSTDRHRCLSPQAAAVQLLAPAGQNDDLICTSSDLQNPNPAARTQRRLRAPPTVRPTSDDQGPAIRTVRPIWIPMHDCRPVNVRICRIPDVCQPGWWLLRVGGGMGGLGYFGGRPAT